MREERRKARRADQLTEQEGEPGQATDADPFLTVEVKQTLAAVLRRLKPREQHFLYLYYYDELPQAEIAGRLGVKPERLRLIKSRALKNFRELYQRLIK